MEQAIGNGSLGTGFLGNILVENGCKEKRLGFLHEAVSSGERIYPARKHIEA